MTGNRSLLALVALIAALALSAIGAITATAGAEQAQSPVQLAGGWDVTVDRAPPLTDLKSLQTITAGGSIIEIANGGTALRSPGHGVWERIGGRRYASTMEFFRYDSQNGAYLGTQRISSTLTLSPDGASFDGVAISTLYDPAGYVVLGDLRANVSGIRIQVERD